MARKVQIRYRDLFRQFLDGVYFAGGILAAFCLLAILAIILLQMSARWVGEIFPGSSDYAGYFMAAASFFAFAHALSRGSHIRVSIVLFLLGRYRYYGEIWCFVIGSALSSYFAYYAIKHIYWSWKFQEISQGQDALPLWIPQLPMGIGAALLALCFWDNLLQLLLTKSHGIVTEELRKTKIN